MKQQVKQEYEYKTAVATTVADVYRLLTSSLIEQEQAHFQTTD
jgi:hypothetical protein